LDLNPNIEEDSRKTKVYQGANRTSCVAA